MSSESVCEKGKDYGWLLDKLQCIGWNAPDGYDLSGHNCWDYFDSDGVYLGPDEDGIEPIFEQNLSPYDGLVLALKAALSAPTEEQYQQSSDFAEQLIEECNLSREEIARAWKEADTLH